MSLAIRQPDFTALYPTLGTFNAALSQFDAYAGADATPGGDAHRFELLEKAKRFIESGELPSGASLRLLADAMSWAKRMNIVSEHEGLIQELLVVVPKFDIPATGKTIEPRLSRHFITLLRHYGDAVRFVVVSTSQQRAEFEGWMSPAQRAAARFVDAPLFKFTHWAQDPFLVLFPHGSPDFKVLLEGVRFTRSEDMTIADEIAVQHPSVGAAMSSYLFFQGGNVLGGRSLTLIGQDFISRNGGRDQMAGDTDVIAAFARQLGTPVLALGGKHSGRDYALRSLGVITGLGQQPIFHIDMYVTRTGVTDPLTKKEIVFLGRPSAARAIVGQYSNLSYIDNPLVDTFFDETEVQLSQHFTVKHLPLWFTFGQINDPKRREKYYVLTWNNALVENDGTKRRVLLPRYDDPGDCTDFGVDLALREQLQQAAEDAWKSTGFEVRLTDGVEDLAWGDGSIHCLVKVLRRS